MNNWQRAILEEADQRYPKWVALIRLRLREGREPAALGEDIQRGCRALPVGFVILADTVIAAVVAEGGEGGEEGHQ